MPGLDRTSKERLNTTIDEIAKRRAADDFAKAKKCFFPRIVPNH
jgi:hypothetical protein